MKRLVISFAFFCCMAPALAESGGKGAVNGPTLDQTIQYIVDKLNGEVFTAFSKDEDNSGERDRVKYESIDKKDKCIISFRAREYGGYVYRGEEQPYIEDSHKNIEIDFSKIYAIDVDFSSYTSSDMEKHPPKYGGEQTALLLATDENLSVSKRLSLVVGETGILFNDEDRNRERNAVRESQIYKAFQHMRALCNAPQPVHF